jgi:cytochrome oxidase assembly protein ShyY1
MSQARSVRSTIGMTVFALTITAILSGLGFWQLERRDEKHALIAALNARLAAEPVALPPSSDWARLTQSDDEFRRVRFTATFENKPDAMIYTSSSAVRSDVKSPGAWAFLPARLESGEQVVINAGFVPNEMQGRAEEDRAVAPLLTGRPETLTGYLRFPEHPGLLTARENGPKRLWFIRDVPGIAASLNWGTVAPFYIDLETPMPAGAGPKPGALVPKLRDNHLQYAITWFGLALAVFGTFGFWLFGRRRA